MKKFIPTKLSDLVFEDANTLPILQAYAHGKRKGNLILYGPYGTGKSTAARIVAEMSRKLAPGNYDMPTTVLNGANVNNNIDQKLVNAWSSAFGAFPYVIIDEFDLVSHRHQAEVRATLDKYGTAGGLIMTTNNLHNIDEAIQSRSQLVHVPSLGKSNMAKVAKRLLSYNGVNVSQDQLDILVKTLDGSIRSIERQVASFLLKVDDPESAA